MLLAENPPDKIMAPAFAPNIAKDDPRLAAISEKIRRQLLQAVDEKIEPGDLEVEAKIGVLSFNDKADKSHPQVRDILAKTQSN